MDDWDQPGSAGRSAAAMAAATARRDRRGRWAARACLVVASVGAVVAATSRDELRPAAALIVAAGLVAWMVRPHGDALRWERGADGERATARLLADLPRAWAVLHDRRMPGSAANIDHLVIGRRLAWVVDSKTFRHPVRMTWRGVRAGTQRLDTAPVVWEAQIAADRLGVEVWPVVAVHAEGLHRPTVRDGVAVVPARRLHGALRRDDRRAAEPRRSRREVRRLVALAEAELPPA